MEIEQNIKSKQDFFNTFSVTEEFLQELITKGENHSLIRMYNQQTLLTENTSFIVSGDIETLKLFSEQLIFDTFLQSSKYFWEESDSQEQKQGILAVTNASFWKNNMSSELNYKMKMGEDFHVIDLANIVKDLIIRVQHGCSIYGYNINSFKINLSNVLIDVNNQVFVEPQTFYKNQDNQGWPLPLVLAYIILVSLKQYMSEEKYFQSNLDQKLSSVSNLYHNTFKQICGGLVQNNQISKETLEKLEKIIERQFAVGMKPTQQKTKKQETQQRLFFQMIQGDYYTTSDFASILYRQVNKLREEDEDIFQKCPTKLQDLEQTVRGLNIALHNPQYDSRVMKENDEFYQDYIEPNIEHAVDESTGTFYEGHDYNYSSLTKVVFFQHHSNNLRKFQNIKFNRKIEEFVPHDQFKLDQNYKLLFQNKGICTLQKLFQERQKQQYKWYQNQGELKYIAKQLFRFFFLIHSENTYYSGLNLRNISLQQQENNKYSIFINNLYGLSVNNWELISIYCQQYYPNIKQIKISKQSRQWADFYQIGRVLLTIMLSSIDETQSQYKNDMARIQKALVIVEEYYEENLVNLVKYLLSPFSENSFEYNLEKSKNLIKLIDNQNYETSLIHDQQGIVESIKNQQKKKYGIDTLTSSRAADQFLYLQVAHQFDLFEMAYKLGQQIKIVFNSSVFDTMKQYQKQDYDYITLGIGLIFITCSEYSQAITYLDMNVNGIENSEQLPSMKRQAILKSYLGLCYSQLENQQTFALQNYENAIQFMEIMLEPTNELFIQTQFNFASFLQANDNKKRAQKIYQDLQQIFKEQKFQYNMINYSVKIQLALIYYENNLYENSAILFQAAISLFNSYQPPNQEFTKHLGQAASVHLKLNQYQATIKYLQKAIQINEQLRISPEKQLESLRFLGETYSEMYKENDENDVALRAIYYFQRAKQCINSDKFTEELQSIYNQLAFLYFFIGNYHSSEYFFDYLNSNSHQLNPKLTKIQVLEETTKQIKNTTSKLDQQTIQNAELFSQYFKKPKEMFYDIIVDEQLTFQNAIKEYESQSRYFWLYDGTILSKYGQNLKHVTDKLVKEFPSNEPSDFFHVIHQYLNKMSVTDLIKLIKTNGTKNSEVEVPIRDANSEKNKDLEKYLFNQYQTNSKDNEKWAQQCLSKIQEINESLKEEHPSLHIKNVKLIQKLFQYLNPQDRNNIDGEELLNGEYLEPLKTMANWPAKYNLFIIDTLKVASQHREFAHIFKQDLVIQIITLLTNYLEDPAVKKINSISVYIVFFINLFKHGSYQILQHSKKLVFSITKFIENNALATQDSKNFQQYFTLLILNFSIGVAQNVNSIEAQIIDQLIGISCNQLKIIKPENSNNLKENQQCYYMALKNLYVARVKKGLPDSQEIKQQIKQVGSDQDEFKSLNQLIEKY